MLKMVVVTGVTTVEIVAVEDFTVEIVEMVAVEGITEIIGMVEMEGITKIEEMVEMVKMVKMVEEIGSSQPL